MRGPEDQVDPTERALNLAQLHLDQGRPERALEVLSATSEAVADPTFYTLRAEACHELDRPQDALRAAEAGLELDPEDHDLMRQAALSLEQLGDLGAAEAMIRSALKLYPESADLLVVYVIILTTGGETRHAHAVLDIAERLEPQRVDTLRLRGVLAYTENKPAECMRLARSLLQRAPEEPMSHQFMAIAESMRPVVSVKRMADHQRQAARLDPSDRDCVEAGLDAKFLTHPLMLPVRPLYAAGPAVSWMVALGCMVLIGMIDEAAAGMWLAAYLLLVLYSWAVPPLVRRWVFRNHR